MSQTRRTWYFVQNAKRKRSARTLRVSLKMPRLPRLANKAPVMQAILSLALKNKTQHQVVLKVLLERFSYELEMKTREQNGNNKRTEIERLDRFIERIQTRVAFGWLSESSGENLHEREFSILRFDIILQQLANQTMPSPY